MGERVTDRIRVKFLEAFSTITALKQECIAGRNIAKALLETARFTRKYKRRIARKLLLYGFKFLCIRVVFRNMFCWHRTPGGRCPGHCFLHEGADNPMSAIFAQVFFTKAALVSSD